MKIIITKFLVSMMLATTQPGTAIASDATAPITTSKAILSASEGGFFAGRKAQNKRNRRTKKMNRRNGVGMVMISGEVANA